MENGNSELILEVGHVKYRNNQAGRSPVGTLRVYREYVEWTDNQTKEVSKFPFFQIKGQRVSPLNKTKVQLQLCLQNDDQATFMFINPALDKEGLIKERDLIKESLQQALLAHRQRVSKLAAKNEAGGKSAELEAKQKLLLQDKQLEQLYKHLVSTKLITPQDFWTDYYKTSGVAEEQVGVSGGFLADIVHNDGQTGVKLNLSTETIQAIFNTYPIVERKHLELVPHEMTEEAFWLKFFQSHYFYRQREVLPNPNDPFSDCVKLDDDDISNFIKLGVERKRFDLNYLSDNLISDITWKTDDEPSHVTGGEKAQLMRRCNYLSERILQSLTMNLEGSSNLDGAEASTANGKPETSGFGALNRGVDQVETRLESAELDEEVDTNFIQPVKVAADPSGSGNRLSPTSARKRRGMMSEFFERNSDEMILGDLDWCIPDHDDGEEDEAMDSESTSQNGVYGSHLKDLAPGQLSEIRIVHDSVAELLKHFWSCFPANTPELKAKLSKMMETLEKYQGEQLAAAAQRFGKAHFVHCFDMLELAKKKFTAK
ncbi:unnamed protein product, partial [Mesorhabditis spiculigera]